VQFRSSFQARWPSSGIGCAAAKVIALERHQRIRECTTIPGGLFRGDNLGKMLLHSRLAAIDSHIGGAHEARRDVGTRGDTLHHRPLQLRDRSQRLSGARRVFTPMASWPLVARPVSRGATQIIAALSAGAQSGARLTQELSAACVGNSIINVVDDRTAPSVHYIMVVTSSASITARFVDDFVSRRSRLISSPAATGWVRRFALFLVPAHAGIQGFFDLKSAPRAAETGTAHSVDAFPPPHNCEKARIWPAY